MKTDRLIGIITTLQQNKKVTAPYLAEKFEVSRRTVSRDIDDICKAGIGILPENIFIYELRYLTSQGRNKTPAEDQCRPLQPFHLLSLEETGYYDAIYFCGGDPKYLLTEVNRTGFNGILKSAVENGLFYIGASAGAVIAAGNLSNNLGFMENHLYVHCRKGTPCGKLPAGKAVRLTDMQAVWIEGDDYEIIE